MALKKYKLKTHKGAARRFKVTGTGLIMRTKHNKSHNRRKKSMRIKRQFDRMLPLSSADEKRVRRMIPYGLD